MIERFQIYVSEPGTLAANGGNVQAFPKQIDTEAPFALRGISMRVARTLAVDYLNVQSLLFRFKTPWNTYTCQDLLSAAVALQVGSGGNGGIGGCPGIVYPELVYPAGATIDYDLTNNNAANALTPSLYFWGVKLFESGYLDTPTYPARCSLLDYKRQITIAALGGTETRRDIQLKVQGDADYVFRGGQAGCNNTFPNFPANFLAYKNVFVTMSDHKKKPYMDAAVDINYLWGTNQGTFGQSSGFTSNPNGGLHVPEIYVPANDYLWFDLVRKDSAFSGQAGFGANDIQFVFFGSKVYGVKAG